MEDAPYGGYIRDAVTDSEVQRVEIEDYASLRVRFPSGVPDIYKEKQYEKGNRFRFISITT